MMAKQAPIRAAKVAPMQSFSLGKRRKKRDGWLMSFTPAGAVCGYRSERRPVVARP